MNLLVLCIGVWYIYYSCAAFNSGFAVLCFPSAACKVRGKWPPSAHGVGLASGFGNDWKKKIHVVHPMDWADIRASWSEVGGLNITSLTRLHPIPSRSQLWPKRVCLCFHCVCVSCALCANSSGAYASLCHGRSTHGVALAGPQTAARGHARCVFYCLHDT